MILVKDKVKRELTDKEIIKMFIEAGWKEEVKVEAPKELPKAKKEDK